MKKATTEVAKAGNKRPDFSGVPGELIEPDALPAGLVFGAKRRISPYDALLEKLKANPQSALRFGDVKAYPSVQSRAKKMGLLIECAFVENALFVRMKEFHGDRAAKRREQILALMKPGLTFMPPALAAKLRESGDTGVDGQTVAAILAQMARIGEVIQQEGGAWTRGRKQLAVA